MDLQELFQPDDLLVDFAPADKWAAIAALVELLVRRSKLAAQEAPQVLEAVVARERSMSTGMERGVALPHAAVDGVRSVLACMGIVSRPEGLAFESIDARPARLVVLLVIPRAQKLLHIRTLADVARVLGVNSVREALLAARTPAEAWSALGERDAARR